MCALVTGVTTCALPICVLPPREHRVLAAHLGDAGAAIGHVQQQVVGAAAQVHVRIDEARPQPAPASVDHPGRSEECRVGKEWDSTIRSRRHPYHQHKKPEYNKPATETQYNYNNK